VLKQILLILHVKLRVQDQQMEINCLETRNGFQHFKSQDISAGCQPLIRGVLKRNVSASQEEEEDVDYVSKIEAMETRFQIRRELEL